MTRRDRIDTMTLMLPLALLPNVRTTAHLVGLIVATLFICGAYLAGGEL